MRKDGIAFRAKGQCNVRMRSRGREWSANAKKAERPAESESERERKRERPGSVTKTKKEAKRRALATEREVSRCGAAPGREKRTKGDKWRSAVLICPTVMGKVGRSARLSGTIFWL